MSNLNNTNPNGKHRETDYETDLWHKTSHIALRAEGIPGGGERAWCAGRARSVVGPCLFLSPCHAPYPDLSLHQFLLCPAPSPCHGRACHSLWGICSCIGWHADARYPGLLSLMMTWWQWGWHEICHCPHHLRPFYHHMEKMGSLQAGKNLGGMKLVIQIQWYFKSNNNNKKKKIHKKSFSFIIDFKTSNIVMHS